MADVSGPGALSRRTDRGPAQKIRELPDAQYGEAATYKDLQQQAPLAQTPNPASRPAARGGTGSPVTPMGAPSQRPNEPVTAGADAGEGPGLASLGIQPPVVQQWQTAQDLLNGLLAQNPDDSAVAYLAARLQGRY